MEGDDDVSPAPSCTLKGCVLPVSSSWFLSPAFKTPGHPLPSHGVSPVLQKLCGHAVSCWLPVGTTEELVPKGAGTQVLASACVPWPSCPGLLHSQRPRRSLGCPCYSQRSSSLSRLRTECLPRVRARPRHAGRRQLTKQTPVLLEPTFRCEGDSRTLCLRALRCLSGELVCSSVPGVTG